MVLLKLLNAYDRSTYPLNNAITSKDFKTIEGEYNKQDIHKVAIIESETNGIFVKDNTIGVDLASPEAIATVK